MLRHLRAVMWVMVPVAVLSAVAACATSRSRQRPIEGSAVNASPGSLESVRRQLEGQWDLVSAEVVSAAGTRRALKAHAVLSYDAYSRISIACPSKATSSWPKPTRRTGRSCCRYLTQSR